MRKCSLFAYPRLRFGLRLFPLMQLHWCRHVRHSYHTHTAPSAFALSTSHMLLYINSQCKEALLFSDSQFQAPVRVWEGWNSQFAGHKTPTCWHFFLWMLSVLAQWFGFCQIPGVYFASLLNKNFLVKKNQCNFISVYFFCKRVFYMGVNGDWDIEDAITVSYKHWRHKENEREKNVHGVKVQ